MLRLVLEEGGVFLAVVSEVPAMWEGWGVTMLGMMMVRKMLLVRKRLSRLGGEGEELCGGDRQYIG